MHIKSVGAALALAMLSTTAMAADLPSRRAPPVYVPPPIPVFSWTGMYVGVQAGYDFGKANTSLSNGLSTGSSPSGVIGGAHVGYLFSASALPVMGGFGGGGLVLGVEGDVDGSSAKSSNTFGGLTASSRDNIQGSVRGRLGIAVDRVLFYATGGAAFGGIQNSYFTGAGLNNTFNHTRIGYTVGGGVEYAFTPNWSARLEYRYTDYGTTTDTLTNGVTARTRINDNRVQAGVSYKFDTLGVPPVVARY